MEFLGIKLVGMNPENGKKLFLTIVLISAILFLKWIVIQALSILYVRVENQRVRFWSRQGVNLFTAFVLLLTVLSI